MIKNLALCFFIITLGCMNLNKALAQEINKPSLNHIAVYVHNLETSTAFYKDIIGLELIPEPFKDGRHTWFTLGNQGQLHLISGAKRNLEHDKNSHLCFSIKSIEDFITKLEKNKIDYSNWKGDSRSTTLRVDGIKQIYFQDPDGYWIEINNDI